MKDFENSDVNNTKKKIFHFAVTSFLRNFISLLLRMTLFFRILSTRCTGTLYFRISMRMQGIALPQRLLPFAHVNTDFKLSARVRGRKETAKIKLPQSKFKSMYFDNATLDSVYSGQTYQLVELAIYEL